MKMSLIAEENYCVRRNVFENCFARIEGVLGELMDYCQLLLVVMMVTV